MSDGYFNKIFHVIQWYGIYCQHIILTLGWRGLGKLQVSQNGVLVT
jgi:hypothetical protein